MFAACFLPLGIEPEHRRVDAKLVGPGLREVAKKYAGRADAAAYLAGRIRGGGSGVWGAIPMPPQSLAEADAQSIAQWLADGARK